MIQKFFAALAGLLIATQVQAAPITIDFEGTIDQFENSGIGSQRLASGLAFGDRYTASFTVDSEAPGVTLFVADELNYRFQSFNMVLSNGETLNFSNVPEGGNSRTGYVRLSERGVVVTSTGDTSIGVEYVGLVLASLGTPLLSGTALSDLIAYAQAQDLSGATFRKSLSVRLSNTRLDTVNPLARCTGNCTVEFSVQELSLREADLAPVPLPAAGWLLIAAFGGLGVLRRTRRQT